MHILDGAAVVERGKTRWTCLVEVKTGAAALRAMQVSRYLELARENRLDAMLTTSSIDTAASQTLTKPGY